MQGTGPCVGCSDNTLESMSMDVAMTFSTVVFVGDHPLLVACAGRAREAGLDLLAISTQDPDISSWAGDEGIEQVSWMELTEFLHRHKPDVLLSVGNLRILPEEMISAAGVAINFHDGPLPSYAGLHTPMWALLAGEDEYHVTWHVVEGGIDQGAVLATSGFEIAERETTRSMNIKCFGAAGDAFEEVLAQLTSGRLDRTEQVGEGKYFARYDRPLPAGALVPHTMSAAELERYVRALDFGPTINRVGRPLLQVDDENLVVVHTAAPSSTSQTGDPGAVLAASVTGQEISLTISTTTDPLDLTGWAEPGVDVTSLVGSILPDPSASLAAMEKLHGTSVRSEVWWSKRLTEAAPVDLQHFGGAESMSLAEADSGFASFEQAAAVAAAFVLSHSGQQTATIGLGAGHTLDAGVAPWFSTTLPLTVAADFSRPATEVLVDIEAAVREALERGPFLRDVSARMPAQVQGPVTSSDFNVAVVGDGVFTDAALEIVVVDGGDRYRVRATGDDRRLASRVAAGLEAFARAVVDSGGDALRTLPVVGADELAELLGLGGAPTEQPFSGPLHEQFIAVSSSQPDAVAVVHGRRQISYRELEDRARRIATALERAGVQPGGFVGVSTAPGLDMVAAILGVLMSGAAYVPLDPRFPSERLAFMVSDADMDLILTDNLAAVPDGSPRALDIAATATDLSIPLRDVLPPVAATDLAYMMYTSGSTGLPKGVMVQHGNVDSFLMAMEPHVGATDGVWLSVTTLSFDISVLELFYPLLSGWKVVLYEGLAAMRSVSTAPKSDSRLDMSLFFFGSEGIEGGGSYDVLLDVARFADANGFAAIWTPERHFHAFGGPFPNPAVAGAAVAAITENVGIRSGSCVLPLHHPVRVAEEWAVVDQLSGGRVGLSVAAGWHPDDFVLRPQNYRQSKAALMEQIEQLRSMWRGEPVTYEGPVGPVEVITLPRPVQAELPTWYTTAGNIESFELAGRTGLNLLTHLLGQTLEELAEKVVAYRNAWDDAGHEGRGTVSLMLHTFVTGDPSKVEDIVREPMKSYLKDSIGLVKDHASAFPTFDPTMTEADGALAGLTPEDLDALLDASFSRYYKTSGLFGDVQQAVEIAESIADIDVDEIAALVDFGIDGQTVLDNLDYLNQVRAAFTDGAAPSEPDTYGSIIAKHGVTHLQCTPSEARIIMGDSASKAALGSLDCMLVGGEACPVSVAAELHDVVGGRLINVYGPTETTIWSTIHTITRADLDTGTIPIGRPLANTFVRVAGPDGQLRPNGGIGELLIGGSGVTAGYHDRPELTADRFVERDDTRGPVYRTGDMVSWRSDGKLDFHGRADSQVKLRGHRIELGEIEAVLEERDDTAEAVVVVHGHGEAASLVGHLVASTTAPDPTKLRTALATTLPTHMVPERFQWHDTLPTTPNGKVDRKALAVAAEVVAEDLQAQRPAGSDQQVATGAEGLGATELAELITSAWQFVLGVDAVDRDKSFFDHGGNSLQMVRLRDVLEEKLVRPVSLVDVFRYWSVNELANAYGSTAGDGETNGSAAPAEPAGDLEGVGTPAVSGGERLNRRAAARRRARQGR